MKLLWPTLALALSFGAASAQEAGTAKAPPGLTVVGQRWEKIHRNPALDEDPMAVNDRQRAVQRENEENLRRQRDNERVRNDPNMRQTILTRPAPAMSTTAVAAERSGRRRGPWTSYVYRAKIRNEGTKAIRSVVWDYAFADPRTGTEVGRHRILSEVSVRPGKGGELVGRSVAPPALTVDAETPAEHGREKYRESVFVLRVDYADGSFWQHPEVPRPL